MDSCTLGQSVVHFLTVNYSVVVGGGGPSTKFEKHICSILNDCSQNSCCHRCHLTGYFKWYFLYFFSSTCFING